MEIKDDETGEVTHVSPPEEMVKDIQGDADASPFAAEVAAVTPEVTADIPKSALDVASELAAAKAELAALKAQFENGPNKMASTDVSALVSSILREVLPAAISASAVGIAKANQDYDMKKVEVRVREMQSKAKRCSVCNLPETACGGAYAKDANGKEVGEPDPRINHIKYYCGPKDEDLLEWFQGVIIRNVRFLSDYFGHLIWIPKKSDIPTIINAWEQNEKALSRRRKGEGKGMKAPMGGQNVGYQGAIGWR
jgi:hypothetical protein